MLFILSSILLATLGVSAAPLPPNFPSAISSNGSNDAPMQLSNALLAQDANRKHRHADAKATLPCGESTNACVAGDMAECVGGVWKSFNSCTSAGLSCFFLPDPTQEGITMTCIDEPSALKVFEKAGAPGGFLGSEASGIPSTSTSVPIQTLPPTAASTPEVSVIVLPTQAPTATSPIIVIQTVTAISTVIVETTTTVDVTLSTETLSPQEASSFTQTVSSTPSSPIAQSSRTASQTLISLSAIQTTAPSSSAPLSSTPTPSVPANSSTSLVPGPVIVTLVPASVSAAMADVGKLMDAAVSVDKVLSTQTSSAGTSSPSTSAQPYSGSYN